MKTISEAKTIIKLKILRIAIALNDGGLQPDEESNFVDELLDTALALGIKNRSEVGKVKDVKNLPF